MEEDYYKDDSYEDEEDSEQLILSIGDDGKADIMKESDYVQILEKEMNLIRGFLKENEDAFNKYLEKKGSDREKR